MTFGRKFGAALGALVLTGLGLVTAAPASAEVQTATGGSLQWGIKSSLLSYHIAMHTGTTQATSQGDGASASTESRSGGGQTWPAFWNFPFESGSWDTTATTYTAQYGGYVEVTDSNPAATDGPGTPASPFKYIKFARPKVVLDFAGGARELWLDVTPGAGEGPAQASGPAATVLFATLAVPAAIAPSGGAVAYSNLDAAITAAGANSLTSESDTEGFGYSEGEVLDAVTTSLSGLASGGTGGSSGGSGTEDNSDANANSNTTSGTADTATTNSATNTGPTFSAGPPPPPPGGWFGPPMGQPGMAQQGAGQQGVGQPMVGGSQYNPPPWFRPRPPPGFGMPPPGYPPPQQFQQPQFQQQYAAPAQQPAASVPMAQPAPVASTPPSTQVASSAALPGRAPRPIPRATGPADGELVDVAATDVAGSEEIGVVMFAVVLGIGALIAYFTSRGVRDAIAVRGERRRPARR